MLKAIALEKLATLRTQCLMALSVRESWMKDNIKLVHKKDVKELRIILQSGTYKVFTKAIVNRIRAALDIN